METWLLAIHPSVYSEKNTDFQMCFCGFPILFQLENKKTVWYKQHFVNSPIKTVSLEEQIVQITEPLITRSVFTMAPNHNGSS